MSEVERLAAQLRELQAESADRRSRIEEVVSALTAFAGLDFSPRPAVRGTGDHLDALAASVTMLAEELQASQADLRHNHAVLSSLVESLEHGVVVADPQAHFLIFNAAAERILGRGRRASGAKGLVATYDVLDPEGRPFVEEALPLTRALRGETSERVEMHIRRPDGTVAIIEGSGRPLRASDGAALGGMVLFRDVTTERRAAREQLLAAERYRRLFTECPIPLIERDTREAWRLIELLRQEAGTREIEDSIEEHPEWVTRIGSAVRTLAVNQAALSLLALPDPTPLLDDTFKLYPSSMLPAIRQLIVALIKGRSSFECEGIINVWGGGTRPVLMRWNATDPQLSSMVISIVDLSARKQIEESERRARLAAEQASQAKSDFLASMSHELRTPLNGVIGMAGFLLDTPLSPEQREMGTVLQRSAETLLALVNDILDLSKIEAGMMQLEPGRLDLLGMVEDVAQVLAPRASQNGTDVIVRLSPDLPRWVRCDAGRLRQVLTNLGGNAVKFTKGGHVLLEVIPGQQRGPEEVELRFRVQDTGIGIPLEKQGLIFDKFTQADASTTRKFGGTGLGLAITKQLVELMGGRIAVASKPGEGSTFSFTLRLPIEQGEPEPQIVPLRGARVLLVDDDPVTLKVLREQVLAWGLRDDCCTSGAEALELIRRANAEGDPFRFALLDDQMPGMSGQQLAQAIRREPGAGQLLTLILSSSSSRPTLDDLRAWNVRAFLSKPVRRSTLLDAMMDAHAGRERSEVSGPARSAPRLPIQGPEGIRIRVLVAEDNAVNQKVALRMLEKLGCRADVAADGVEALQMARMLPYDLIFMDCEMPNMDGYTAARELRALGLRTPIVATTAHAMSGDREACLRAGMDDYVSKPLRIEDLQAALRRWAVGAARPPSQPPAAADPGLLDPEVVAQLREIAQGDPGFLPGLLASYEENSAGAVAALAKAREPAERARLAHGLVGSSRNLGARAAAELAAAIERGEQEATAQVLGDLSKLVSQSISALRVALAP